MKVYCKDCRYYVDFGFAAHYIGGDCLAESNKTDNWYGSNEAFRQWARQKNENNDCPDYQEPPPRPPEPPAQVTAKPPRPGSEAWFRAWVKKWRRLNTAKEQIDASGYYFLRS